MCCPSAQDWLRQRDLPVTYQRSHDNNRWRFFTLDTYTAFTETPHGEVANAWHGTWFYALWNLCLAGTVLESNDTAAGHEFWMPGACLC